VRQGIPADEWLSRFEEQIELLVDGDLPTKEKIVLLNMLSAKLLERLFPYTKNRLNGELKVLLREKRKAQTITVSLSEVESR
jgi:hypothetical protein